ncbi:MAG: NADPH:quinone oxidoreductase [Blastopirellula sp.]|nr:MAG: NADPH:quinone oxidoreductase [Blastopirellula sp.]
MMQAWISGEAPGIENLQIANQSKPIPGNNELLVWVTHAALNFSDLLMIDEQYQVRPPRPFIPGQEIAGIVEQAPTGSKFSIGDKITSKILWGGFAQFAVVRDDMAIAVSPEIDLAAAVALPVSYVTALVALDHCSQTGVGKTVLVHAAAGGVGLACIEVAVARGATVIATAGATGRVKLAIDRGASHGVNYREDDWFKQVKSLTNGRGADIIVDPVGGQIGEDSLRCIAMDGTLLIVGFSSGKMPKLAANRLLLKRASAKGVYWNHDTDFAILNQVNADLSELLSAGKINPQLSATYQFDDLPKALDDLANRRVMGKVALHLREPRN